MRRIEQFANFLRRLTNDGCDVQRPLNACIKLHDVASCAIAISKTEENSQYERVALGRSITSSQLEVRIISVATRGCVRDAANQFSSVDPCKTFHR